MSEVVRKAKTELSDVSDELSRSSSQVENGLAVKSELSLGVAPCLMLSWTVDARHWKAGYRLLVFHSTSAFCSKRYPDDLSDHGRLIIDTTSDGSHEQQLAEGSHFFTFAMHKDFFGLARCDGPVVRIAETVTTAKIGIDRIRDKAEFEDLLRRHQLSEIDHVSAVNEAKVRRIQSRESLQKARGIRQPVAGVGQIIAEEMADIDAVVATLAAKRRKIEELENDAEFRALSTLEKEHIMARINERLEPGAISARRTKSD